jgi:hypothetical protein
MPEKEKKGKPRENFSQGDPQLALFSLSVRV